MMLDTAGSICAYCTLGDTPPDLSVADVWRRTGRICGEISNLTGPNPPGGPDVGGGSLKTA
jgi:hypothetical protein